MKRGKRKGPEKLLVLPSKCFSLSDVLNLLLLPQELPASSLRSLCGLLSRVEQRKTEPCSSPCLPSFLGNTLFMFTASSAVLCQRHRSLRVQRRLIDIREESGRDSIDERMFFLSSWDLMSGSLPCTLMSTQT